MQPMNTILFPAVLAVPSTVQASILRPVPAAGESLVLTTAGPDDGIAASPRLRQQMSERAFRFQVGPIKEWCGGLKMAT
jgi:hypothetical protein